MTLLHLSDSSLMAANRLGSWLAKSDFLTSPAPEDTQLVVLAGNAVVPTIEAACRLVNEGGGTLLISGGIGHSTSFLYDAIAAHPRYHSLDTDGKPEATLLAEVAHSYWQIPRERILLEEKSTNCGENARFTRRLLEEKGLCPSRATVIQDPTMQRRTMATFARVWQDAADAPRWLSYPGYRPELINTPEGVAWKTPQAGLWPVARYLSLILGELPRLRDDAQGYGPKGKDFIAHVIIPEEVEAAWLLLSSDPQLEQVLDGRKIAR